MDAEIISTFIYSQLSTDITPHSAFNTKEAVQRILDTTVENITAFTLGKPQNIEGDSLSV